MTILDDKLRPGVKKVLLKTGAPVVLTTSATAGEYDPTTGAVVYTPVTYTVLATPPSPFAEESMGAGKTIRKGDMTTLLSALLLDEATVPVPDPLPGWTLTLRSKIWQVTAVEPIMSGEQVAAWTLKLER